MVRQIQDQSTTTTALPTPVALPDLAQGGVLQGLKTGPPLCTYQRLKRQTNQYDSLLRLIWLRRVVVTHAQIEIQGLGTLAVGASTNDWGHIQRWEYVTTLRYHVTILVNIYYVYALHFVPN